MPRERLLKNTLYLKMYSKDINSSHSFMIIVMLSKQLNTLDGLKPRSVGLSGATPSSSSSSSSGRLRPFSAAHERRPSVGILDIIPEVVIVIFVAPYNHNCLYCKYDLLSFSLQQRKAIVNPKHNLAASVNRGIDVTLSKLDVLECCCTCTDQRFPGLDTLNKNKFWISTGLYPHQLSLRFLKKWVFRRVELQCIGGTSVEFSIGYEGILRSMATSSPGEFSCDLSSEISSGISLREGKVDSPASNSPLSSAGLPLGDTLIIRFPSGVVDFLIVQNLVIKAYQYL